MQPRSIPETLEDFDNLWLSGWRCLAVISINWLMQLLLSRSKAAQQPRCNPDRHADFDDLWLSCIYHVSDCIHMPSMQFDAAQVHELSRSYLRCRKNQYAVPFEPWNRTAGSETTVHASSKCSQRLSMDCR